MSRFPQLARLIHENLSIVMCFAYSRKPLTEMMGDHFAGGYKYLERALFEISEERATKALFELALFLRILDDDEDITGYQHATDSTSNCGTLIMADGLKKPLAFRDATNKIIHSSRVEWEFNTTAPNIICYSRDSEKWQRAEINSVSIAALCGQLAS